MKAVVSTAQGPRVLERDVPEPAPHEVLVRVAAAGMNRVDLLALRDPRDQVFGMEWAGEVVKVGNMVGALRPGDPVMCTGADAYAEFAVTDAQRCVRLPPGVAPERGASMLLGLQTMHDAIVTRGRFVKGNSVLFQGAASCMGVIGMQMAKLLGASVVAGTSRNAAHREQLGQFGCDAVIDSSQPGWHQKVLEATGGNGAAITVDQVSGDAVNEALAATAIGGTLVNVGRLGGASAAFDFNLHALRRISYVGVTFRTRSREEIRSLNQVMADDMLGHLDSIEVPVAAKYSFSHVAEALQFLAEPTHLGKVLLVP